MSWAVGFDDTWRRDIGYGVPAFCDHPDCDEKIDRGLSYVCCNSEPYGGDQGCGRYFCSKHESCDYNEETDEPFCTHKDDTHISADHSDWIDWKLNDESWKQWRDENPKWVVLHQDNNDSLICNNG